MHLRVRFRRRPLPVHRNISRFAVLCLVVFFCLFYFLLLAQEMCLLCVCALLVGTKSCRPVKHFQNDHADASSVITANIVVKNFSYQDVLVTAPINRMDAAVYMATCQNNCFSFLIFPSYYWCKSKASGKITQFFAIKAASKYWRTGMHFTFSNDWLKLVKNIISLSSFQSWGAHLPTSQCTKRG